MKKIFCAAITGAVMMMGINNTAMAQNRNSGATGAIIGAGIGALAGAAINKYNPGAGAAIGGLIGAGVGYMAGSQQNNTRNVVYVQNRENYRQYDRGGRYYNDRNRRDRRYNNRYDNCGRPANYNYNNGYYGGY